MERERKKELSFGVIFSFLSVAAQCLSGIIYTPIIIHSLGQSEYGVYSLCVSFSSYLSIFSDGMNAAYVRYYVQTKVKNPEKLERLNGVFMKVFLVLALFSLVAGSFVSLKAEWIFGSKISPAEYDLLKISLLLITATTFLTVLNCLFGAQIVANERFIFAKILQIVKVIAAPILTIPYLLRGANSTVVLLIKLLLAFAVLAVDVYYCFKCLDMKIQFGRFDWVLLQSIASFAGFLVLNSITDQLNWQIDKFILARMQGTLEVSVYSVGSTLSTYYMLASGAMSGVFIAEINCLVAKKDDIAISRLFIKASRIFSFLLLLIISGFCIFGKAFIATWAGKGYESSYFVGLFIMLPLTLPLIMSLGLDITRAKNLHKKQIVINLFVCIGNLLISIPLAKIYGAVGSAMGTMISEVIIGTVVMGIYYQRIVSLPVIKCYVELLKIAKGLVIPAVFGYLLLHYGLIKNSYISILLYALLYSIVYGISFWFFSLNSDEKEMIKRNIKKMLKKLKGDRNG